jgi:transcriptional regulator with XRE-family HTH domain
VVVLLMALTPFAEWLHAELRRRKLSQSKLAAYLGVHPSGVNRWLTKGMLPSTESCAALARVLHVDLNYLMRLAGHLPEETGESPTPASPPDWIVAELSDFTDQDWRVLSQLARVVREMRAGYEATPTEPQNPPLPTPRGQPPRRPQQ